MQLKCTLACCASSFSGHFSFGVISSLVLSGTPSFQMFPSLTGIVFGVGLSQLGLHSSNAVLHLASALTVLALARGGVQQHQPTLQDGRLPAWIVVFFLFVRVYKYLWRLHFVRPRSPRAIWGLRLTTLAFRKVLIPVLSSLRMPAQGPVQKESMFDIIRTWLPHRLTSFRDA